MGSIALVLFGTNLAVAATYPKLKVLPSAMEAKWIQSVKHHRTKDGSTVSEVLAYAERMRPRKFKAGRFEVGYNGATGSAETVGIGYWIGAKRSPDDAFVDLGYHMSSAGQVMPVPNDEAFASALEGGRDTFLRAVDETYRETCAPDPNAPTC
jgi:hypothetical protein